MLVAVGSALFTITFAYGFHDFIAAGGRLGVRIQSFEVGDEDAVDRLVDLPRGVEPALVVRTLVRHENVRSAAWGS